MAVFDTFAYVQISDLQPIQIQLIFSTMLYDIILFDMKIDQWHNLYVVHIFYFLVSGLSSKQLISEAAMTPEIILSNKTTSYAIVENINCFYMDCMSDIHI